MGFTETLRLLVEADTKGAVANVEKLGAASEREFSKSKNTLDKWGNGLTKVGAGMMAFGSVALVGLGHAAMAFEEAHLSEVKLENTLKNMPKLAGENKQQFIDLAGAIQDKTAADADAIVEGEALLGTFQLTAKEIKGITPLVVDYARKFGMDIPQASIQVGKALDGQVGALKRNGVSIDETLYKTDRYAAVQKALAEQVGGFAEAEGKTFAGSLQRLKNQLGDIEEGVGKGAVDAFTSMFGVVDGLTDKLNDLSPNAQATIGKVATYGSVALIAAGATSTLIGQVIKARDNFQSAWGAVSGLADRMGGFKSAAIVGGSAVAVLTTGYMLWSDEQEKARKHQEMLHDALEETNGAIKGQTRELLIDSFRPWIEGLNDAGIGVDELTDALDGNKDAIERVRNKSFQMGNDGVAFRRVLDDTTGAVRKQRDALDEEAKFAEGSKESTDELSGATDDMGESMDESADKTSAAEDALKSYQDTLRGTFDPIFAMSDALQDNQQAHADLIAKQMEAIAAEAEMRKQVRLHGEDSKAGREAIANYMEAQQALTDAQHTARSAVVDLQGAAADLRFEMNENGLTAEDARTRLIDMARSMGYTQAEAEQLAADFGFTTAKAQELGRQRPRPNVAISGASAARTKIRQVKDDISSLDGQRATVHVAVIATGMDAVSIMNSKLLGPGRARGGPVFADRLYPVAEGGKSELLRMGSDTFLIPGQDGEVIANDKIPSLAGAGVGSVVHNHFHIAGSVIAENQLMELVNKRTRKGRGLN